MDKTAEEIIDRYNYLKSERANWDTLWQECADHYIPRKNDIQRVSSPGEKKGIELYDPTGMTSNELLAGALHGMLTNPSGLWFELTTGDEDLDKRDEVRFFLDRTARQIHHVLNNTNFQTEVHEYYLDLCAFGTGSLSVLEDDNNLLHFVSNPLNQIVVDENHLGEIDTFMKGFNWDVRKIVQMYGEQALSNEMKREAEKQQKTYEIIWCVKPRNDYNPNKKGPANMPFESRHVLVSEKRTLKVSGFSENPHIVARWSKASGEKFGRGPGTRALPATKMLQAMHLTTIKGAQKTVDPPLMIPYEAFIGPIRTTPGGLNVRNSINPQDRIEPFGNDARVDFGVQMISLIQQQVREAFYVDQLQLGVGPQMTATEVVQRMEDKLKFMGPMLGRQHSEFARKIIDRSFGVLMRKGIIDRSTIPSVLSGRRIDVRYSSMIAKAQRQTDAQNIQRMVQDIAPFYQHDPSIMDNFDLDSISRYVAKLRGIPQELITSETKVKSVREARIRAQEQELAQKQEHEEAQAFGQVGPAAAQVIQTAQGAQ